MIEVNVSEIKVENRVRASLGSLDALERSIERLGVLQPIGITPDKKLIFGERRLQACKNIGKETIPARIFDVETDDPINALRMERAENVHRLDLTPSEKVEIGRRIEEAVGKRQGQRTDFHNIGEPVPDLAQVQPGMKTREIAATAVGMKRETYRQAKAIVDSGNRKAIEEMDSGKAISSVFESHIRKAPKPKTIKITLYNKPEEDAEALLTKGGKKYCTALAIAILRRAGHKVEV